MVLARANSCSKQKSSSCSPVSFVSPKPYSPTADDFADGCLLPTLTLKSLITSSTFPFEDLFNCSRYVFVEPLYFFFRGCCRWSIHLNQRNVSWFRVESHNNESVADWFISDKCSSDFPMNPNCHFWHALSRSKAEVQRMLRVDKQQQLEGICEELKAANSKGSSFR